MTKLAGKTRASLASAFAPWLPMEALARHLQGAVHVRYHVAAGGFAQERSLQVETEQSTVQ
ncbi:hypothetical protein [Sorangium sp. So ce1097]|uniref:hypothetical protein n=1 Tax=Sorangium sp. So ce1097 TaxID=3133330 RepID=UPI003F625DE1